MPQNKKATAVAQKQTKVTVIPDEEKKALAQHNFLPIAYVLKKLSSKEKPMSAKEITNNLNILYPYQHFSERTILRNLQALQRLKKFHENNPRTGASLIGLMRNVLGGEIMFAKDDFTSKRDNLYYFEPNLSAANYNMITASITSNRYLSQEEKEQLCMLLSGIAIYDTKDNTKQNKAATASDKTAAQLQKEENERLRKEKEEGILKKGVREGKTLKAGRAKNNGQNTHFLNVVNQLHTAIRNRHKVEIIYGNYCLNKKKSGIADLRPVNQKKPYLLNPYALFWNDGHYYLIATHKDYDNPVHFRVDRILNIEETSTEVRAIPEQLKEFFTAPKRSNPAPAFLADKYNEIYPLAGIYDYDTRIICRFRCKPKQLSILVDTFGPNMILTEAKDFPDMLEARIEDVQYDCARLFAVQQHEAITAISPPELVEDVKNSLKASLAKL